MPMRNAGTGPRAAPTPAEVYAWRSRPAAKKAKCIISRSISRLGIEGSSSARTMRKHRARPASQLSGHEQATATAEFSHRADGAPRAVKTLLDTADFRADDSAAMLTNYAVSPRRKRAVCMAIDWNA